MDKFCGSEFWVTNYTWTTDNPRFTPCFEETVLVWIPCSFLWLISIFEIWRSFRSALRIIPWNILNISKVVACSVLIIVTSLDLSYALYWHPVERIMYGVDYSSSIIKHFTFILAGYIILVHRKYGVRTSAVMFVFWFLLFACGLSHFLSQVNTAFKDKNWRIGYIYVSNLIYYCVVIFMFVLSVFVDSEPQYSMYPPVQKPCPDTSSSFLTNWLTLWFDSFALKAYKDGHIESNQLWDVQYENSLEILVPKFEQFWNSCARKEKKDAAVVRDKLKLNGLNIINEKAAGYQRIDEPLPPADASILPILWKCFGRSYVTASMFKFCADMLVFLTPLLLNLLINFGENKEPIWHGYVYAVLLPSVGLFQTLLIDWYVFRAFDLGIRIRSTLTSVIYKKALRISNSARRSFTIGEVTNLMSVDSQRFLEIKLYINMAIAACYQITIALLLLWNFLGPSMLAGLAVMIVLIPLNGSAATKAKSYQILQMKYKDERIKIMNEVLSGIKTIKMYAWEGSFEQKITKIREKEIDQLKRTAYLNTGVSFIWSCTPFLVSLASFAVFTLSSVDNVLNAQTAFVSLALFNIIRLPISLFPRIFPNVIQTYVAIKRINRFLNAEELDNDAVSRSVLEKNSLVIKDSSFCWDKIDIDRPILSDINFNVPSGSLTAVVGTVGAGKSSLVCALLGQMHKICGHVNIKGSVAYVPQQAWLLNATLRNNIVFASEYKSAKYNQILEACALKPDLKMLPGGDSTEIGERGINLSGGQKQRISLARAVYHDADVYLLDDPLSAVDAHVGKHIFDNVIGPNGLLRRRTRLFVTHAISFLPEVDFIIVIKDGVISDRGTYNELLSKGGSFSEFLTNNSAETNVEETVNEEKPSSSYKINRSLSEETEVGFYYGKIVSQVSEDASMHHSTPNERLTEDEHIESGSVRKETYLHYFKCSNINLWMFALLFEIVFQGFTVASNFTLSDWSTDPSAISCDGTQNTDVRNFYLTEYFLFGVGQFVFIFLSTLCIYVATIKASSYLHSSVLGKVLRWPSYLFDVTPIGRILSRLSFDVDVIDNTIPFTLLEISNMLGIILSVFCVIIYTSAYFIIAAIPLSIIYIIVERLYVCTMRQLKRLESASRSPIYSHFGETVSGASVIRAYDVQKKFVSESERRINVNQVYTYASIFAARWVGNRMNMLGNTIVFLTALLAVIGRDTISSGIIGLSVTYVLQISGVLFWFVKMATDLETNIVSVERLRQFENTAQEESGVPKPSFLSETISSSWPENGEVIFRNFKVRYRSGLDPVLRGISFKADAGQKIGIVGRTGAGKSSLTLSLFRLIEPVDGSIVIDGIDISTIDLHTLRSRLTIIPQDPVIFSGSLRFNLDPFSEYTDQKIYHALELAHLKSYVSSLPDRLRHVISESGENLSVGQRQLLCLARALLRKTKILILDEATAAVDLETDDLIQRTIRAEFKDCTVFTIAHRLNTIMDSDKVIVLDKGLIVEYDKPNALLNLKNGVFQQMAKDAGIIF